MKKVKLGDVCKIQSGGTPSRGNLNYWNNGNIPWVKISDIKEKHLSRTEEFITQEGLANSSAKIFPKETILYTIFATLGEVSILEIEATTNQAIAGLQIIDENICKDYLYYYLISLKPFVNEIGRGVAQNNINMQILRNFEIPLPSLEEQKAIARKLDKVSGLIEKRKTQLEKLSELVKSRFIEMFGTLSSNEQNFEVLTIEAICSLIKDGTHQTPTYTEDTINGFKFLSSKDVMTEKIDWSDIKYIPSDLHDKLYAAVKPIRNDILMSKNGVNYGVAAVNNTDEVFDIYVSLALLRPKTDIINPVYFRCAINNPDTKRQFDGSIKGIGVPNLHLGEIKNTQILVPPMDKQIEYVSFVEQIDKSKYHGESTYEMEVAA